jgi:predicted MFS family arabinose efflux permease
LWISTTVSDFGTYVTTLALQVLVVRDLHASAAQVGLVNMARWLPYLLFGLLAGVYVDRHRRRPVLIGTDLGRAVLLGVIPLLAATGRLNLWLVAALMVPFGLLSLLGDAADQSFLPCVVPAELLNRGNAALQQSSSVAQSAGPLVGGGLVAWLGAPLSVLVDAVSYLVSGLIIGTIRADEPAPVGRRERIWPQIGEGLAWVYRHPKLGPLSWTTHVWFVFGSMVSTVFVLFALRDADIGAFGLGVAYACAGVGGVLGTALSDLAERRLGAGPAVVTAQLLLPFAYLPIVLAGHGPGALVLIGAGQFLFWIDIGFGSPIELTYRQVVTPDHLLGRASATIRSLNWGMNALGAPLGGVLADAIGYRSALWVGMAGFLLTAVLLWLSPFRHASLRGSGDRSSEQEHADG